MTDAAYEKIEPTLQEIPKSQYEDPNEYFIYRPDVDPGKLAMGIHPAGVPFEQIEFDGSTFHVINDELWMKNFTGVDSLGVYVLFYRQKGEFKGYGV